MTPPAVCLNCHGSPETPPVLSELERLSQETEAETLPSHCHAHERWPVWLRTSHQGMQRFPWWVRGNYETTRGSQTPFRIDIEDADIDLRVHTRAGADLPLVRGAADWLNLHSGDRGVLTSANLISPPTGKFVTIKSP